MRFEKKDKSALIWGALLVIPLIFIWIALSDWYVFKGSFLINAEKLSETDGMIVNSSTYTSKPRSETLYHYKIEYEYKVDNVLYRSDKVAFVSNDGSNFSYIYSIIEKYPKGKKVKVYYDNKDPKFCVLEKDKTATEGFLFILFSVLCVSLGITYYLLKK